MKKIAVVLFLVCGFSFTVFAQTSTDRSRRIETAPVPKASPQPSGGNDGDSNSVPVSQRQSKLPAFLGGSVNNNGNNGGSAEKPKQTESAAPTVSPKSPQKPPVLIAPSGLPASPAEPQTSSSRASATSGETSNDEDEVIKVETELVTIPVTVLDRQGHFMVGLQQSDFKITEDGQSQEIAYFNTTEQSFTVVLLLDVSNSTKFKINEIQDAAIAFIDQLKQNDRVMVISFDDNINVLSEPTSNRQQLYDAIRQANFDGGTSLYDAVDFAINRRLNRIEGRKAVVLFTDGVDTTSKNATYQSTIRDSEELDATVYPVYYNTYNYMQDSGGSNGRGNYPQRGRTPFPRRGGGNNNIGGIIGVILGGGNVPIRGGNGGRTAGSSRSDYERGEQYLEDLAAKTGGRKYDADSTQNLEVAFSSIAEELRRQYSIGYYPTGTGQAGQRKQVNVSVDRPNSIVRARDSYIVGEQKTKTKLNFGR